MSPASTRSTPPSALRAARRLVTYPESVSTPPRPSRGSSPPCTSLVATTDSVSGRGGRCSPRVGASHAEAVATVHANTATREGFMEVLPGAQLLHQLNLSRVVEVVCRNPHDKIEIADFRSGWCRLQVAADQLRQFTAQRLVSGLEQRDV